MTDPAMMDKAQPINRQAERRRRITGAVLVAMGLLVAFLLDAPSDSLSTFKISRPRDMIVLPHLVIPSSLFNMLAAALLAFLGFRLLLRGGSKHVALFLGTGLAILVLAFLVWATAGKSISLTGMMQATVVRAVPIALAAMAGILCERVAVINIGIEGMLLAGAFSGALVGSLLGGWAGIAAAIVTGGLFGLLLAALVITYRVDQIIAGVVINLFVLGLTSYISSQVFSEFRFLNNANPFRAWKVPFLGDMPLIGPMLFNQNLVCLWGDYHCADLGLLSVFHPSWPARPRGGRASAGCRHTGHRCAEDALLPCYYRWHDSRLWRGLVYPGVSWPV